MRQFMAAVIVMAMLMSTVVYGFDGSYSSEDYEFTEVLPAVESLDDAFTIPDDILGLEDIWLEEESILTSTLDLPVGMQGFEGPYALGDPNEIVEIIVQFATPPSVALQIMEERQIPVGRALPRGSFEMQALSAHAAFSQQLNQIPMPFGAGGQLETFEEYHELFNGVFMRVPGSMVQLIAGLPEVYGVFPSVTFEPLHDTMDMHPSSIINSDMLREARELFNTDYIHNQMGFTGEGVRVAVLDNGIQHSHPEFSRFVDNTGRIPGWEFYPGYPPANSHGTAVSGVVVGIAPNIELWHYRVNLNDGGGGTVIGAIHAAREDNMDIINMSFGNSSVRHPFCPNVSTVNMAVLDGIIAVAGAGNWGGWLSSHSISSPGTAPLAITVGMGAAGGGQYGIWGDIVDINSSEGPVAETSHIKPDIIAPGVGIYTTELNSSYSRSRGTSIASPMIAGVAALLLEAFPDATPQEIKAMMMNTARPLRRANVNENVPNRAFTVGAGFVQPIEALTSQTLVTVEHYVPLTSNRLTPFVPETMASLSFGGINRINNESMNKTLPVRISNRGTTSRTYTISHRFVNNLSYAANLNISNTSVTVAAGATGNFNVTMVIGSNAPAGYYQGYVSVSEGATVVARLPFAAVVVGQRNVQVSSEAALRSAVANTSGIPTVIELMEDITLIEVMLPLIIPGGAQITLRSGGEAVRTLKAGGDFDVVRNYPGAQLTLDGGIALTRVAETNGRGIVNFGRLTMFDGVISGHRVSGSGGGIHIAEQGTFIMMGGEISNNQASQGGGVITATPVASFIMHGGIISDNNATFGGGVQNNGVFNMEGGEISGNAVIANGGGIGISVDNLRAGRLQIGENAIFENNRANIAHSRLPGDDIIYYENIQGTRWTDPFTQGFNNFDIGYTVGSIITVRQLSFELNGASETPTSPLTIDSIRVIENTPITGAPRFPNNDPERDGYTFDGWYLDANFTIPLNETTVMPAGNITLYAGWTEIFVARFTVRTEQELRQAIINAGTTPTIIELAADITLNIPISLVIPHNSTITLRSAENAIHSITATASDNQEVITVVGDLSLQNIIITRMPGTRGSGISNLGHLTILEGTTITDHIHFFRGAGIHNDQAGTIVMQGGTISGNTTDMVHNNNSGGAGILNLGSIIMEGGYITGNTSAGVGGGVLNRADFVMKGGQISNNFAPDGGGGVSNGTSSLRTGNFYMYGGVISRNTVAPLTLGGGGVKNASLGDFIMYGGSIENNTASDGGGVLNRMGSTFVMEGGEISGNSANLIRGSGGGVNCQGIFIMRNGTIRNNTTNGGGGGVMKGWGDFIMEGGEISDNVAVGSGGGVILTNWSPTFTMHDGIISGNEGAWGGGVVNNNGNTFTMFGGVIKDNVATVTDGGGVHNAGAFIMHNGIISGNTTVASGGGINNLGSFTMNSGEISGNSAQNNGGGILISNINTLTQSQLNIGASAVFANNSAGTSQVRNPAYEAAYYQHIHATQWTQPFTQGLNNYDVGFSIWRPFQAFAPQADTLQEESDVEYNEEERTDVDDDMDVDIPFYVPDIELEEEYSSDNLTFDDMVKPDQTP